MKDGSVRHRDRSLLEEVEVDADGMHIRLEVGTGYERCDMSTSLPMSVLVGLFERAGFTVAPHTVDDVETLRGGT